MNMCGGIFKGNGDLEAQILKKICPFQPLNRRLFKYLTPTC